MIHHDDNKDALVADCRAAVNLLLLSSPLSLVHSMTIMNPSSAVSSSSSAAAAAAKSAASSSFRIRPSIILFGDSITQQGTAAWASLLAAAYSRRADVFNRGFSGYNTQWAVDRLLTRVFGDADKSSSSSGTSTTKSSNDCGVVSNVAFCTVFFGANDAALPGQRQHVPIDQYQQNLVTIVKHIQSTLSCVHTNGSLQQQQELPILLLTPPPFDADAWMAHKGIDSPGRSNDVAREYGERVKLVAEQMNNDDNTNNDETGTMTTKCAVIDTWNLLQGSGPNQEKRYSQYLSDGLHLNEAGNRIIYEAIMDVLQRQFPNVAPAILDNNGKQVGVGLPLEEPMWDELC